MSKIANANSNSNNDNNNNGAVFLYTKSFLGFEPPLQIFIFCILPMVAYLFCLYILFPALKPRSKEAILNCNRLRYYHNVVMSVYSLGTFLLTVKELVTQPNEINFLFSLTNAEEWKPMMCTEPTDLMKTVNWIFIWSKIVEWIDTAWIVWLKNDDARAILKAEKDKNLTQEQRNSVAAEKLSAKPQKKLTGEAAGEITFLHAYHHLTTFFAFLIVTNLPGAVKMGPLLNGFVHFLMYLHYAHPLPRVFVPFITISQILQFFFVIYLWVIAPQHCPKFNRLVKENIWEYRTPYLFTPVFLIFFIRYFLNRWVFGGGKKKKVE